MYSRQNFGCQASSSNWIHPQPILSSQYPSANYIPWEFLIIASRRWKKTSAFHVLASSHRIRAKILHSRIATLQKFQWFPKCSELTRKFKINHLPLSQIDSYSFEIDFSECLALYILVHRWKMYQQSSFDICIKCALDDSAWATRHVLFYSAKQ